MSERTRRTSSNEALFRMVNAEIEKLGRGPADISDRTLHIVCECSDLTCAHPLVVELEEFRRIRVDETLFVVEPGHEDAERDEIIERTQRYLVIRKGDQRLGALRGDVR